MPLPTGKVKAKKNEPSLLFIVSAPKTGKTSSFLKLPNSLVFDLESGCDYYEGSYIDLKGESISSNRGVGSLLLSYAEELASLKANGTSYDFIVLDTLTSLEQVAKTKATWEYKKSTLGKNFTGDDVTSLPDGAGYYWYSKAFMSLITPFYNLANKCLILSGHIKVSKIDKTKYLKVTKTTIDIDPTVHDVNLLGSTKLAVLSQCDSIGLLTRDKNNPNHNIISFSPTASRPIYDSRCSGIKGKNFILSKYDPKLESLGETYWDLIFPSILNGTDEKKSTMVQVDDDFEEFLPPEEEVVTIQETEEEIIVDDNEEF